MKRLTQRFRSKKQSRINRRRFGSQIENLEQRRMMFGDIAVVGDHLADVVPLPGGGGDNHDSPRCIDFEDLPAAASYNVGNSFVADNSGLQATFSGRPFEWSNGVMFGGGSANVSHANLAADAGQEIGTNNILLDVDFGQPVEDLSMKFGEYGGNINLSINGDFHNFEDFALINGANIGGTLVTVANGFGNDAGELKVDGVVNSFAFGGQELWVDHICAQPSDQEFRIDWGDAPDSYRTLAVHAGAHHLMEDRVYLGAGVDGEADGQPSVGADRDDAAVSDDEDGVKYLTPLVPGQVAQVEVVASVDGWLNAWVDFDQSGSFDAGPENVFSSQPLIAGANVLNFLVPHDAVPGEQTYSRWRFSTTHNLLDPWQIAGQPTPNGEVEDHLTHIDRGDPDARLDWGDAPDQPYPTLAVNNGARHLVNPDVFLGTTIDAEIDGQPDANSQGDDAATVDDEDGVVLLTPMVPGKMAEVRVTASTDGFLNAWVDFDQDANWSAADQVFNAQPLVPGVNVLNFLVPNTATVGDRAFSRWRFSTTHKELTPEYNPEERVPDGEVEDHRFRIVEGDPEARFDWGDAPDKPYPTLDTSHGARHEIDPNVFLGRTVDAEPNGQPSINSQRDDANGTMDDEDGVRFLTPLIPGSIAQVEVIASTDGWLNAWVDFDRNGDWLGGGEDIFAGEPLVAGINVLNFNVPAATTPAPNEPTYSRWRFSTTDVMLAPDQTPEYAPNGEVEDHLAFIDPPERAELDFGDAPDRPYPTLAASNGARHEIDPDVFLGRTVDAEPDGQPSINSQRDDANGGLDDEDGVQFLTPLVPGGTAQVDVVASTDGWLNAWVDFDRNGIWSGGAENVFSAQPLVAGSNILSFNVPAGAIPGPNDPTYTRWRFSTTDRVLTPDQPAGYAPNGEVEDHLAFIQEPRPDQFDFGDAPDEPYPTLEANDGARHIIDPEIFMGHRIDAEVDGQPSYLANRDDAAGIDDEDGVFFVNPIVPGTDLQIDVLVSVDGHLDAWMDFNQDGHWDPSEQIAVSDFVTAGMNTINVVVPGDAAPNPLRPIYSRFRFSLGGGLAPRGAADNGEVEDYASLNGDINEDGIIDDRDIDLLCGLIHGGSAAGDLNNDGNIDEADMDYLVQDILGTNYGDANLDGLVNSDDLVHMFIAGEYLDGDNDNSGWSEGDFNCDRDFDQDDLVKMFITGAYMAAPAMSAEELASARVELGSELPDENSDSAPAPTGDADSHAEKRQLIAMATDSVFGDDEPSTSEDTEESLSEDALDEFFALV